MNTEELHRAVGRIEGRQDMESEKTARIERKLDAVLEANAATRGRDKLIGGALSAIVAFCTAWFTK